jgi:RimJ/RimL family protein N-acetyltransferase
MNETFRGIALRPVVEDDMPLLFRIFADPRRSHLWMQARRVHDERGFYHAWAAWTSDMIAAKFIVESAGQPVGLVFDYQRTLEDGFTKVTALLEEERVGRGAGVVATVLLIDWLFRTLPFRKVYLETYGYNRGVVRMLRKVGLAEEGVMKGSRYWNGSWWDVHIFAVYPDGWPEIRGRVLGGQREEVQTSPVRPEVHPPEARAFEPQVSVNGHTG